MKKILTAKFFNRPTLTVAKELIGKYLVRKIGKKEMAVQITEVEAYDGLKDKASHAFRGQTQRNAPMFSSAGNFYIYFTYGMHWMLNVVTGPKNYPAAVLIRGTKEVSGPARLTKFLGIDKSLNDKPTTKKTGLWFEDRGDLIKQSDIKRAPRIGVNYAGPIWSKKKYRFLIGKTR